VRSLRCCTVLITEKVPRTTKSLLITWSYSISKGVDLATAQVVAGLPALVGNRAQSTARIAPRLERRLPGHFLGFKIPQQPLECPFVSLRIAPTAEVADMPSMAIDAAQACRVRVTAASSRTGKSTCCRCRLLLPRSIVPEKRDARRPVMIIGSHSRSAVTDFGKSSWSNFSILGR